MPVRYLTQAAIARRLGLNDRHLINRWRNRYRDTYPFPEPDAWAGDFGGQDDEQGGSGKDVPLWLPERMGEIGAWNAGRPGQGAGGGRPRRESGHAETAPPLPAGKASGGGAVP